MTSNEKELFYKLCNIALDAGTEIMKIYSGNYKVNYKTDNSPVTAADIAAHNIICEELKKLPLNDHCLPIISEEGEIPSSKHRKSWDYFWLVDPLDGTKEFVSGNGEFTVNIALIKKDYPYLGVVYIPVKEEFFFGGPEFGSYKTHKDGASFFPLEKLPSTPQKTGVLRAAGSRSHRTEKFDDWVNLQAQKRGCNSVEIITAGSSLKFCLAAEGLVDVYPRFGTTMEWDTAAAHAVAEGAGKRCLNPDGSRMSYNKTDMKNNGFILI
ncbi:MAG: 3'(2'),5'-bisphosphate nucleotidase CysQ [Spirochaetales bacterium]|nr:3'(2'),5'-bisphosphate nucleotidase CysQ [Spirochaetales bacterium]